MPIRCMLYDAISYTKQGDALKAQYKEKRKESKDNVFPNMTFSQHIYFLYLLSLSLYRNNHL